MKILLDTHTLLWWLNGGKQFSQEVIEKIADPHTAVLVSAATAWEIEIKRSLGKLSMPDDLEKALAANDFLELPVEIKHTRELQRLPYYHRDPFDRILIAQALSERATLATRDPHFVHYQVAILAV